MQYEALKCSAHSCPPRSLAEIVHDVYVNTAVEFLNVKFQDMNKPVIDNAVHEMRCCRYTNVQTKLRKHIICILFLLTNLHSFWALDFSKSGQYYFYHSSLHRHFRHIKHRPTIAYYCI